MCEFFELSEARCGPGVDRLGQGLEVDAALFEIGQQVQKLDRRLPDAVELPEHKRVAGLQVFARLRQGGPMLHTANAVILLNLDNLASGAIEGVDLHVDALVVGKGAGVSDQAGAVDDFCRDLLQSLYLQ